MSESNLDELIDELIENKMKDRDDGSAPDGDASNVFRESKQ